LSYSPPAGRDGRGAAARALSRANGGDRPPPCLRGGRRHSRGERAQALPRLFAGAAAAAAASSRGQRGRRPGSLVAAPGIGALIGGSARGPVTAACRSVGGADAPAGAVPRGGFRRTARLR